MLAQAPVPKRKGSSMNKVKAHKFAVRDHVLWNSEAGEVAGTIIRVHLKNVEFKGYTHHATPDDPQYEIKSDKSEHIALHKGSALKIAHLR